MALRIASSAAAADHLPAGVHRSGPLTVPPRVPRSIIPPSSVQENAWSLASPAVLLKPTTWPAVVHRNGRLKVPPRVPRSIIPPFSVQENAWLSASPAVLLTPTTWPLVVHGMCLAEAAAEGAEVDHAAPLRPGERTGPTQRL